MGTSETRDAIMFALAEEVMENGAHEFAVQAVADRAGVSHRTVYRYYPTREELINAFAEWANEHMGFGDDFSRPETLSELAEKTVFTFRHFDSYATLIETQVALQQAGPQPNVQRRNSERFSRCVEQAAQRVESRRRRALAALVRNMVSSQSWARGRHEFDVDGETLGEATAWALELISTALDNGQTPEDWEQEDDA